MDNKPKIAIDTELTDKIVLLRKKGLSFRKIALEVGVSATTVSNLVKQREALNNIRIR